jgi:hypothetical protein
MFMLFIQQKRVEMQTRKLIAYHDLRLSLCNPMGVASVARLQREEMSTTQERSQRNWYVSYRNLRGLASSLNLQMISSCKSHREFAHKSTGSTACFKTHGNCMVNLIVFIDHGAPFNTFRYTQHTSLTLPMASVFNLLVNGNFRCVFAIKFYLEIPNPIHRQWRPFHITHSQR